MAKAKKKTVKPQKKVKVNPLQQSVNELLADNLMLEMTISNQLSKIESLEKALEESKNSKTLKTASPGLFDVQPHVVEHLQVANRIINLLRGLDQYKLRTVLTTVLSDITESELKGLQITGEQLFEKEIEKELASRNVNLQVNGMDALKNAIRKFV